MNGTAERTPPLEVAGRITRQALWPPLAVILLHAAAAARFGHEPYVDPVMHFLGGAAAAFFFRQACCCARSYLGEPNDLALGLLAFGLTAVAALGWEMAEFAQDLRHLTHHQQDVANVMRDLLLGLGGAASFLIGRRALGRTPEPKHP